jgi:hypothetical protein
MPVTMYVIHAVQLVPGRVAMEYTNSADPVRHEALMNGVMYHVTTCVSFTSSSAYLVSEEASWEY